MKASNKVVYVVIGLVIFLTGGIAGYQYGVWSFKQKMLNAMASAVGNVLEPSAPTSQDRNKRIARSDEEKRTVAIDLEVLDYGWYDKIPTRDKDIHPTQDDWLLIVFSINNHSRKELTSFDYEMKLVNADDIEFSESDDYAARYAAESIVKPKFPSIDFDPDVNPATARIAYRLFDVPFGFDPDRLRLKVGMFNSVNVDAKIPKE